MYPWHHGGGNCAETQSLVCPITAPFNTALPSEGDLPDMGMQLSSVSEPTIPLQPQWRGSYDLDRHFATYLLIRSCARALYSQH